MFEYSYFLISMSQLLMLSVMVEAKPLKVGQEAGERSWFSISDFWILIVLLSGSS